MNPITQAYDIESRLNYKAAEGITDLNECERKWIEWKILHFWGCDEDYEYVGDLQWRKDCQVEIRRIKSLENELLIQEASDRGVF